MEVGFIGSGPISDFHLSALTQNGFEIGAIGTTKNSINCLEFAKKNNLLDKYCKQGWEEVLSGDFDAYVICVNPAFTYEIVQNALIKDKPIFVEKPVNFLLSNMQKLCDSKNSNRIFVGYNRRYYQTTLKLKEICKTLEGGTILVNIPDSISGMKQFLENGSHIIDILRYVIGDFKVLNKKIKLNQEKNDIKSISALCTNNQWNVLLNAHSLTPSNFSITVNSTENVYELKPIEQFSHFKGIEIIEPSEEVPIRKYIPKLNYTFFEEAELKPGFDSMYKNFKKFVLSEECHYCSISDATKTLKTSWSLIESEIAKDFVP